MVGSAQSAHPYPPVTRLAQPAGAIASRLFGSPAPLVSGARSPVIADSEAPHAVAGQAWGQPIRPTMCSAES